MKIKFIYSKLLFVFLFITTAYPVLSQVYPTSVTPVALGPCSIYFDDFYSAIKPKLQLNVQLHDQSIPSRDVYLSLKMTGPGIQIRSVPGVRPSGPLTLYSGQPNIVTGGDLADIFDFNRLIFSGITRQQLETNGRLPEGQYTLCFTIYDYEQNVVLSQEHCIVVQLALSDPPTIIAPACGSVVTQIEPPNFIFNWMLTNSNSQIDYANTQYQINLYEITTNTEYPAKAILNNQALLIWQSELLSSYVYNYTIADPVLETGKRYAYTIQAIENYPRTQIKNNGYSAPCWFYYGYPEGGEIPLISPEDNRMLSLSDQGTFIWERPANTISGQLVSYDFKLVKINTDQTAEDAILNNQAITTYTSNPGLDKKSAYTLSNERLNSFEKMKPYAWQVTGKSGQQIIAKSKVNTFIGPPPIENFYAANFLIEVTEITAYDTLTNLISGTGKTLLKESNPNYTSFRFNNVRLESIGNNKWLMIGGEIRDEILISAYTIQPKEITENGILTFQPDSIFITHQELRLGGICSWEIPLAMANNKKPILRSRYTKLQLANYSFTLGNEQPFFLREDYTFPLLEPYGFNLLVQKTSAIKVVQNKYDLGIEGFIELPSKVNDLIGTTVMVPFKNQQQLFYMEENNPNYTTEQIAFVANTNYGIRGKHYFIDISERKSPGDHRADSLWKGVYFQYAELIIPVDGDDSKQLISDRELNVSVYNDFADSNEFFVDPAGLTFKCTIPFSSDDTIKFNTFPSSSTVFLIDIQQNLFRKGHLTGDIQIPVIDTARFFPFTIPVTNYGFQKGNIDESLVDLEFVFNAKGAIEEQVEMKITRAVFKGNNRIEMDIDAAWTHFQTELKNLQGFTAWGNGNIGFDNPNTPASLNSQAFAKSGDYNMVIDYVGCGRDRNVYAFGVSAKMNMAENIAGENSAPVVNAYSMYVNPLLSGVFTGSGSDVSSVLPGFTQTDTSGVSDATQASTSNLSDDLLAYSEDAGIDIRDTSSVSDNKNVLISSNTIATLKTILEAAEMVILFIDEEKVGKARDYITVGYQALNSNLVQTAIDKDPKEFLDDLMLNALEGVIRRVNQPIINATTKATGKFRNFVNTKAVVPINNQIDSLVSKIFDKIQTQLINNIENDQAREAITAIVKTAKNSMVSQIKMSVANSFENNVTSKITNFIENAISKQITDFIAEQIRYMGVELIKNGKNANISINHIIQNAGNLFENLGDTIVDGVKSISLKNILNTGKNLVLDACNGIDWNKILQDIGRECASQGFNALVGDALSGMLNDENGIASSILKNVSFDFSNMGDKIKNGEIDKIVKFDPTYIKIQTAACDVEGMLKHTKDDPVYGDHWRAMVRVALKKPKKITIEALFITGKTSYSVPLSDNYVVPVDPSDEAAYQAYQEEQEAMASDTTIFSYWFASIDVEGINISLSPIPLSLYGIGGYAFHHMQRSSPTAPVEPCRQNKLGLGMKFKFYDTPVSGKIVQLDMQLEVVINQGAWSMEMFTFADVGNFKFKNTELPPLATCTGVIGYYSAIKTFKGQLDIKFNTSPILCAGGQMAFNFDGLNNKWFVYAGTQQNPIYAKLLCKDWLSITSFIEANNAGFSAGVNLNIDIKAKTPWIKLTAVKFRGFGEMYIKLDTYVDIDFDPKFALKEAYVYLSAGAAIGVDYEVAGGNTKRLTLAGISVGGYAHYKAAPEGFIKGGLRGEITIIGISCGFDMNVNYDLGSRSDNS